MVDDGTGYMRVATFNKGKAREIAAKIKELESQGAHKIVLDLRNCAGGDVQEAVDTVSLFLNKGLVTYIAGTALSPPGRGSSSHRSGVHVALGGAHQSVDRRSGGVGGLGHAGEQTR